MVCFFGIAITTSQLKKSTQTKISFFDISCRSNDWFINFEEKKKHSQANRHNKTNKKALLLNSRHMESSQNESVIKYDTRIQ
jgi:hypothetical protein